jgi:hypothetical protein
MSNYEELLKTREQDQELQKMGIVKTFFTKKGEQVVGKVLKIVIERDQKNKRDQPTILMHTDSGIQQVYISDYFFNRIKNEIKPGNIICIRFLGQEKLKKGRRINTFEAFLLEKGKLSEDEITSYGI